MFKNIILKLVIVLLVTFTLNQNVKAKTNQNIINNSIIQVNSHDEIEKYSQKWKGELFIFDYEANGYVPVRYTMKYVNDKYEYGLNDVMLYEMYVDKYGIERTYDAKRITFFVGDASEIKLKVNEVNNVESHDEIKKLSKKWLGYKYIIVDGVKCKLDFHMAYVNGWSLHGDNTVEFWVTYENNGDTCSYAYCEFAFNVK